MMDLRYWKWDACTEDGWQWRRAVWWPLARI